MKEGFCLGKRPLSIPHRRWSPIRSYLIPSTADGDIWPGGERLLGGGQRVENLRDGLLPRAGQASRSADTHCVEGGKTWPGIWGGNGCPFLRGRYGSGDKKEAFPSPPPFRVSSAEMFHWLLDHNCQLTPTAQFRKLNEKNLDVNMSVTWQMTSDSLKIVY